MSSKISKKVAVAAGAILAFNNVSAQTAPEPAKGSPEKLQVTGSRINLNREQIAGVGPVTVLDRESIERSGAVSVETLLQRLPASAGFAGSQTSAYWTSNGWGTAQVNLRGLGINRTLVLLNGRRVVNGGTGANSSVDLNMIPVAMIERIEVLRDGASSIYGADAVAGVVNIITKKALNGGEIAARYGETSRSDGDESSVDLSWGLVGERGSLMTSISYANSGPVSMSSRTPCDLGERNGKLECVNNSSTLGGRARLADGTRINFSNVVGGGSTYQPYSELRDNYNSTASLNAVNPIKRVGFSTFGTLNLNADMQFFTELIYSHRESNQLATPATLGGNRAIVLAANHPTNPTGQTLTLERRRIGEAGARIFFQETDTFRVLAGLKGSIGQNWDWTAALNWGRSSGIDAGTNIANLDRVDLTLDRARCSTAPGAAIPCANYLGNGNVTPAVIAYIMNNTQDTGGNEQKSVTANITGQLFTLPAGEVGFASGIEIRKERGWRNPDALIASGAANANRQTPVSGDYTAREIFAELAVPLLSRMPLVDALNLNIAGRYSDYNLFGSKSTYKLGLDWQVVPSMKIRSNYSTAFRVPNVPELFGGISQGNLTTTDPCSGWASLPASSVVAQNCRAAGVPTAYRQLGNTVLTTRGGNPNLRPEDAKTTTVGVVLTPTKSLTVTVDYYSIKINNAIQSVAGSTKLSVCYNTPSLAHIFCNAANFTRDPVTGEINYLSAQPVNAASERLSGIDLGVLYEFKIAGIASTISADVSRLSRYELTPFPGAAVIVYTGKTTGGRGTYSEWRGLSSLTMAKGAWSGSYGIQYIGGAKDINAAPTAIGATAPSIQYHNLQAKYAFSKSFDISAGVNNLYDKKAPFVQSYTDGNTDTMTYDLFGRRWHVRVGYRW